MFYPILFEEYNYFRGWFKKVPISVPFFLKVPFLEAS